MILGKMCIHNQMVDDIFLIEQIPKLGIRELKKL